MTIKIDLRNYSETDLIQVDDNIVIPKKFLAEAVASALKLSKKTEPKNAQLGAAGQYLRWLKQGVKDEASVDVLEERLHKLLAKANPDWIRAHITPADFANLRERLKNQGLLAELGKLDPRGRPVDG